MSDTSGTNAPQPPVTDIPGLLAETERALCTIPPIELNLLYFDAKLDQFESLPDFDAKLDQFESLPGYATWSTHPLVKNKKVLIPIRCVHIWGGFTFNGAKIGCALESPRHGSVKEFAGFATRASMHVDDSQSMGFQAIAPGQARVSRPVLWAAAILVKALPDWNGDGARAVLDPWRISREILKGITGSVDNDPSSKPASKPTKKRACAPTQYDEGKDCRLEADWNAAHQAGATRESFCRNRGMKIQELIAAQDRNRHRRQRDAE